MLSRKVDEYRREEYDLFGYMEELLANIIVF